MKLILGGPGCGKTTRLMQILEEELSQGVKPTQIAFVAFTRKAAHEARERAAKKFGFVEDDMPYFRTLHSFAFKQLGLEPAEVLDKGDYEEIGRALGLNFGSIDEELGLHAVDDKGSQLAYLEQMSRITLQTLEQTCQRYATQQYWDVKLYADTLAEYKRVRHKFDFTDMLSVFCSRGSCPHFKVVIVDEAQDLSLLQWEVVKRITAGVDRVYIAGDDDQAIYEWAGAHVETFLSLKGEQHVLPVSYRLPRVVFNKALSILSQISKRYSKEWEPFGEGGEIQHYADVEMADFPEGTWLLLARNRYMLSDYIEILEERGYPYMFHGRSSTDNETVQAIVAWEQLRRGEAVSLGDVRNVYSKLRPGAIAKGFKNMPGAKDEDLYTLDTLEKSWGLLTREDWMLAIRMTPARREYYRAIKRRGESLVKKPRITVSTIHQIKGGEADHVLLKSDMAYSSYREFIQNPDSESRVFYVGATRARKSLHIVYPRSNKFFDL